MLVYCKVIFFMIISTVSNGSQIYSKETQYCCKGKLFDLPKNPLEYEYYCCGASFISILREMLRNRSIEQPQCCQGKLYENTPGYFSCCGEELYNARTEVCFDHREIISIPQENVDREERKACGKTKDDVKFYRSTNHSQLCCSGVLHENVEDGEACCGNNLYIYFSSICCDGKIIELDLDSLSDKNYKANSNDFKCCGEEIINRKQNLCCNGKVVPRPDHGDSWAYCCGEQFYINNAANEICVNERIVKRKDINYYVCGRKLYDTRWRRGRQQICFGDVLVEVIYNQNICNVSGVPIKYMADKKRLCCTSGIFELSEDMDYYRTECCELSDKEIDRYEHYIPPGQ